MPSFKQLGPAILPRIFPCFSITRTKMCSWASFNWDSSLASVRILKSHMAHVPCIMMVSMALMCDWFSVAPGPEWPSVTYRACLNEAYSLLLGVSEGPSLFPGTLENIFWFAALVLSTSVSGNQTFSSCRQQNNYCGKTSLHLFSPEPRLIRFFFQKSSTSGIKRVCLSWSLPLGILNSSSEKDWEDEICRETFLELGRAEESLSMTAWGSEFKWHVWAGTVQSKVVKEIKNLWSATHSECCGPPFPSCCSSPGYVSLIKSQRSICPLIVSNWLSYTIYLRL